MSQRQRGRRPVQEITEPQRRTLKEIRLFTNRRGFPPTMKELADILGISHASAHGQVSQLVRKGYLKREERKARGIVILRDPEDDVPDLVAVPIVGLVLMDVQMPRLNGIEAMQRLRADPAFAHTPMVALTALAMPDDERRCREAGADAYLNKPVEMQKLAGTIDTLLAKAADRKKEIRS